MQFPQIQRFLLPLFDLEPVEFLRVHQLSPPVAVYLIYTFSVAGLQISFVTLQIG